MRQIQKETPEATIAILTREWQKGAYRIRHALDKLNLKYEYIKNRNGNPHSPGIKITTRHSAKGLEFDYVLVVDLTEPKLGEDVDEEQYWEYERRVLYVALTRACTYLQLYSYGEPSRLLKELDDQFYTKELIK